MEFNKFTKAQIKRTAMNVWPMVSKRNKLQEKISEMQAEIDYLKGVVTNGINRRVDSED